MVVQVTIDSLIGHSAMEYRKCIGFKLTGAPCTNRNALKDVVKASQYTETASLLHCSTSEGRSDLQWLASLLLCNHDHQKHSYEAMETWQSQARQCLAADQDNNECTRKGEKKQCPQSKNMSSVEKGDSDPKPGDVSDGREEVRRVKTNVQTRSMTARAARKRSEDVELDIKSREVSECKEQAEKVKTNVQTRSMTSRSRTPGTRPERRESPPEFIEHPKSKRHLSAVNADVMKHILNVLKPGGRLSEQDLKPGSIYAFSRISSPGYVKIGLSKRAVEVRLSEWRRQCKYSPHQETPVDERVIPYVYQIERLILAELALHRRKESVCNGGAGCPKVHHEWVEVERSLALEVINRWSSWAETLPYDENGVLCDEWEAHTKVPVRSASRDEREQGNRWQEWIDSFPTSAPPSSEDDPPSTSANSEEQLTAPNRRKVEKGSKHSKLGWSATKIEAIVQPLASKSRMV